MSQQYKFVITRNRNAIDQVQLQEIKLYGPQEELLKVQSASNPGGENGVNNQGPGNLVDGDVTSPSSKWIDLAFGNNNASILLISLESEQVLRSYELFMANDARGRDPMAWQLSLLDSSGWEEIDARDLDYLPKTAYASYGVFFVPAAPPAPPPPPRRPPTPPPVPFSPPLPRLPLLPARPAPAPPGPSAPPLLPQVAPSPTSDGSTLALIIGFSVGGVALVVLAAVCAAVLCSYRRRTKEMKLVSLHRQPNSPKRTTTIRAHCVTGIARASASRTAAEDSWPVDTGACCGQAPDSSPAVAPAFSPMPNGGWNAAHVPDTPRQSRWSGRLPSGLPPAASDEPPPMERKQSLVSSRL